MPTQLSDLMGLQSATVVLAGKRIINVSPKVL